MLDPLAGAASPAKGVSANLSTSVDVEGDPFRKWL